MDALPFLTVGVVAISATVTWALVPLTKKLAWRFGAVARPDAVRRLHAKTTPLWGGTSVVVGVAVSVAVARILHPTGLDNILGPIGLATGILCLIGMWDDVRPLAARLKLVCQMGLALFIVLSGFYPANLSFLGQHFYLGWFGAIYMMGWLVLGINAVNLIDGMDGLASVTGIVISAAIAVIAGVQGNLPVLVISLAMVGGLAGFLIHNLPPATIFLGDSGSTVIGLMLAFLAFQVTADASATNQVTSLALLLFVPLLDTHLAIARRLLMGRNIFHGDRSHMHHQLLGQGLGVWKSLGLLGALSAVSVAAACFAEITGGELMAWAVVLGSTGLLLAGGYVGGQELVLVRQALSGVLRGGVESGLSAARLSQEREILPMDRGLAATFSPVRGASSDHESGEPSEERRVA